MRAPDIELSDREAELLAQIKFESSNHDDRRASIMPMAALAESLLKRRAVPEVRLLYFSDPERNPAGRGKSWEQIFESNGTVGAEILAHPNFWKFLEYFVCGPNLPAGIIAKFKEIALFSGYLTGGDINDLAPEARAVVRAERLNPHEAADEFHKLALEFGAQASSAECIRNSVRAVRVQGR